MQNVASDRKHACQRIIALVTCSALRNNTRYAPKLCNIVGQVHESEQARRSSVSQDNPETSKCFVAAVREKFLDAGDRKEAVQLVPRGAALVPRAV